MGPIPVCAYDMMVYDDEDIFMPKKKKKEERERERERERRNIVLRMLNSGFSTL
jgi:hypothetical protein